MVVKKLLKIDTFVIQSMLRFESFAKVGQILSIFQRIHQHWFQESIFNSDWKVNANLSSYVRCLMCSSVTSKTSNNPMSQTHVVSHYKQKETLVILLEFSCSRSTKSSTYCSCDRSKWNDQSMINISRYYIR